MRHYHNPLYVSHGTADETEGLKQALSLPRNNGAAFGVLVVCPEFPEEFPDYRKKFEESLTAQAEASIRSTKKAIKLEEGAVDILIELVSDKTPPIKIIQYVLQHGHDLLIKEAEALSKRMLELSRSLAENSVQKLSCSLMAIKSQGFASQVKAY